MVEQTGLESLPPWLEYWIPLWTSSVGASHRD